MTVMDDYIARHEGAKAGLMRELADLVRALVPDAGEKISYGMPTFTLNGYLVAFGAFAKHIGLYPGSEGVAVVADELDRLGLKHAKGTVQFPLDHPLPRDLVTRIVEFRVTQQRAKR
ncbi:iron chaperone [Brooklawnia cerclae]|uniref:Uncharacterized protein YdhG (YjbR/CyaY superfamily) n=1 Tax=Brooklawnia cerclae TaxID=349934 RepID=A0ABX0SFF0_9ACTN|nr:DUF1801 domain-containing protein [Brooklawnia cerclae]NIH56033.1 uncharacterized protein YdhG (YjbR/CyaY superfamily) [Brooklawnia cerclae]